MKRKVDMNTLALGNLRHRRRQYAVMITGIIFAMVLSTSIPLLFFSASETVQKQNLENYGAQDVIVCANSTDTKIYNDAIEKGYLQSCGFAHIIGYAYSADGEQRLGASVAWLDDKARELSNQRFIEGGYPQKSGEIAVESNALIRLGYKDAKIGDTISLRFDVQNGQGYLETTDKQYTLCGIAGNKKNNLEHRYYFPMGEYCTEVPALFVCQGSEVEPGGMEKLSAYVTLVPKNIPREEEYFDGEGEPVTFYWYLQSFDYDRETKSYRDEFQFNYIENSANRNVLASPDEIMYGGDSLLVVLIGLIFASCVAIVNSFNNDLKGRKKQIGMLRAVGATRRQIIRVFGREALIISLICAPVSILISYITVKIALHLINSEAVMTQSLIALPVCFALDMAVVMAAAMIPLVSASRISPVQAIRDIENNRKIKNKRIRSSRKFDPARHLARRNTTFYKGSRIAVAVILAFSVVVGCFGYSGLSYDMDQVYDREYDYELLGINEISENYYYNSKDYNIRLTQSERNEIASSPYIAETLGVKEISAAIKTEEIGDYMLILSSDSFSRFLLRDTDSLENAFNHAKQNAFDLWKNDDYYVKLREALGADNYLLDIPIVSLDRSEIQRYAESGRGNIDLTKLDSGEDVILIAPKKVRWILKPGKNGGLNESYESYYETDSRSKIDSRYTIAQAECEFKAGDKLDLSIAEMEEEYENDRYSFTIQRRNDRTVNICGVEYTDNGIQLSGLPDVTICLLTTHEGMDKLFENTHYSEIYANAIGEIDEQTDKEITEMLQNYADKYNGWISSNYADRVFLIMSRRTEALTLAAIMIIGFAVCAGIINNALSAKIRESKKVIGTLRAVGASEREIVKCYIMQMLSMFGIGTGIGYALFVAGYLYYYIEAYNNGYELSMNFAPWASMGMTLLLLVVCAANLWGKIRAEMKNSIVENIREL